MNNNIISLKFEGRDFTEIKIDLKDNVTLLGYGDLDRDKQLRIIIKFLDELSNNKEQLNKLIIKTNEKKDNKKELYSRISEDKYYWNGYVGIIKGKISELTIGDIEGINASTIDKDNIVCKNIEITIQIQSRFDVDSNKKIAKPYFLTTMLLQCKSGLNNNLVPNNNEEFFSDLLLLYLFKEKANNCYLKGLYKTYQRFEKNDDRVKGTIDVARHIRLNMGLENGKIAYSYRENTVDNYLNHLIISAFDRLKFKYPDTVNAVYLDYNNRNFKFLIDTLKSKISNTTYDLRTLVSKNLSSIAHPFYTEYEELRKISLKILRNEGVSMFNGDHEEVNGILFYIPDLWELYLEDLLEDTEYKLYTQGYKKLKIFNYEEDIDDYKKEIYPDYVFSYEKENNEIPFMILDAKFKPSWGETIIKNGSFTNSQLEDYTKCIRDMNSINAHASGTIFPTNEIEVDKNGNIIPVDFSNKIVHGISKYNKIDKFYTFPIFVPFSDNIIRGYSDWNQKFKDSYKKMIGEVKKHIISEKTFYDKNYDNLKKINELKRY